MHVLEEGLPWLRTVEFAVYGGYTDKSENMARFVMLHLVSRDYWLVVRRGPAKGEEELSQRRCSQRLSTALCNEPCIWIQYRGSNRPINSKCANSL